MSVEDNRMISPEEAALDHYFLYSAALVNALDNDANISPATNDEFANYIVINPTLVTFKAISRLVSQFRSQRPLVAFFSPRHRQEEIIFRIHYPRRPIFTGTIPQLIDKAQVYVKGNVSGFFGYASSFNEEVIQTGNFISDQNHNIHPQAFAIFQIHHQAQQDTFIHNPATIFARAPQKILSSGFIDTRGRTTLLFLSN